MVSATEILDVARDFLDGAEWKYDYHADRDLIVTGFSLKNHIKSVKIFITAREGMLQTFVIPAITGDVKSPEELLKFLNWANWNMTSGNFEMDLEDGEIRFRFTTRFGSIESIPEDIIEGAIIIPVMMYEKYGDSIAALSFGFSDALTEIKKVMEEEKKDN